MTRWLFTVVCMMAWFGPALADDVSPETAQRVLRLLEKAEAEPEQALTDLAGLAMRVRTDADYAFVVTERAALLIQNEQLDLARQEMFVALTDREPDFAPRLRNLYATTLLAAEEFAEALTQLEYWAANTSAPQPGGLFLMGYVCVQLERFEQAVSVLERVVHGDHPVRDQWVELLAYAYARAGRTESAIALLQQLIGEHPEMARWWKQLASLYLLLDDLPTGTAGLSISSMLEPMSLPDTRQLARLLAHLGMPAEGAALLGAAMPVVPQQPPDYEDQMLLGELWMLAREFERAIEAFRSAQLVVDHGEPAMMIGQLYAQREEYQPAREALSAAASAYGESTPPEVHYLLAIVEINLGDLQAASAAVNLLAADSDYRERSENLMDYIANESGTQ